MTEIIFLIQRIKNAIALRQDIDPYFYEYFQKTNSMSVKPFLPHKKPKTPAENRANFMTTIKISNARRAIEARALAQYNHRHPVHIVNGVQSMPKDPSKITLERDDLPTARVIADYSGGPLQGAYMGRKPRLNVTRNVSLPVRRISV